MNSGARSRTALITPGSLIVLVVATLALVVCALDDFPNALLFVLLPVSLAAAGCAAAAAARPGSREALLRAGHRVLGLLCILTLTAFFFSAGDWVHLLWNVQFPLAGLLFGSGLLLVRVWPDERRQHPSLLRGWNGATLALLALLILGSIPVVLTLIPVGARPAGRVAGSPLPALWEVARYGFDGTVPALMQPEHADQVARGLGHPPRFVTVPLAATLLAAAYWVLFAALALIGRAIPAGEARRFFLLLSPLVLAPATVFLFPGEAWGMDVWSNEPWIVKAYGPALLGAAVAAVVLFVAVRRDERRERRGT